MVRKVVERKPSRRSLLARAPELQEVGRQLATLALAHGEQDGLLGVRQSEQLRRALAKAGDVLCWTGTAASTTAVVVEVSKDVLAMAKSGSKAMERDLAEELAAKEIEMTQLTDKAAAARELAEDPNASYPAEIIYSYTVRDAYQGLVTRTETVTVNDAKETQSAADGVERNLPGRGELRDLMIVDLKQQQVQLDVMTRTLPDFIKSSHDLLEDVISTLQ